MRANGKSGFALLLIGLGGLIVLHKLGFVFGHHFFGHLMGYLVPIAMVGLGFVGFRSGNKWLGGGIMILGLIILLGKMAGLIGWLIAIGLIVYGVSLLKNKWA